MLKKGPERKSSFIEPKGGDPASKKISVTKSSFLNDMTQGPNEILAKAPSEEIEKVSIFQR